MTAGQISSYMAREQKSIIQLCKELEAGLPINCIHNIPQTVYLAKEQDIEGGIMEDDIVLHSHEQCLQNKKAEAENYRHIEEESNKIHAQRLLQQVGNMYAVVNPPYPTMTTEELDAIFDLPYTRLPHPKYKGKKLPAYEMIKFPSTCIKAVLEAALSVLYLPTRVNSWHAEARRASSMRPRK